MVWKYTFCISHIMPIMLQCLFRKIDIHCFRRRFAAHPNTPVISIQWNNADKIKLFLNNQRHHAYSVLRTIMYQQSVNFLRRNVIMGGALSEVFLRVVPIRFCMNFSFPVCIRMLQNATHLVKCVLLITLRLICRDIATYMLI